MSKGYSNDPRAYGIPIEDWDLSRKGRELLADIEQHNTPGRDGWAAADFEYGNDRKPFIPAVPPYCDEAF